MIDDDKKQDFIKELFPQFSITLLGKGTELDIGGNAVVIAPGIAITCAHVLFNNRFGSFSNIDYESDSEEYYQAESLNITVISEKITSNISSM